MKKFLPLKPPVYPDQERTDLARSAYYILWTLGVTFSAYCVIMSILFPEYILRARIFGVTTATASLVGLWLNNKGHMRAMVILSLVYSYLFITVLAYTADGIRAPATLGYIVVIFGAGLFLGNRMGVLTAVVCSLTELTLVYLKMHHMLPPPMTNFNDEGIWFVHTFLLALSIGFPSIASRTVSNALERARNEIEERKSAESALFSSQQMLRLVLDTIPQRVFWKDRNSVYIGCNESFAQDCGYKDPDEFAGKTDFDTSSRSEAESYQASDREIMENNRPKLNYEELQVRNDGTQAWLRTSKVPLHDKDGNVIGVLGTYEDITERKQAEKALIESETKYRDLIESMPDGYYRCAPKGKYIEANPAFAKMLGYTLEELLQLDISRQLCFEPSEWKALQKGSQFSSQTDTYRLRRKDGSEIWLEDHARCVQDDNGNILYHEGICRDITERKRAEESLERQRLLFENSADIIMYIRYSDGKIIEANRAAEILYGYSQKELLTKTIFDIRSPQARGLVREQMDEAYSEGLLMETMHQRKDGTLLPVEVRSRGLMIEGERILVSIIRDLTERKLLQEQLLRAQKLEGLGQLAGGVAHDYNNILSVIIGYADFLSTKYKDDDPDRRPVDLIINAANRGADLTRQLLAFARKEIISPIIVNANSSIESIQKMLQRLIGENLELIFMPQIDLWNIMIDPSQLDQILVNLVTNARDAIEGTGTIMIKTSNAEVEENSGDGRLGLVPGEYVKLTFADTGKGMDKDTLKHMFEPFFTTKPKGQGTGLGLSTVYGIVKQNNGSVHVTSQLGAGTEFNIYLPRYYGDVKSIADDLPEESLRGTQTVLVVEDQADLLELVNASLRDYGYEVMSAPGPDEALLICKEYSNEIHLLLTDVIMPTMSGRELSNRIAAVKPGIKVLFMSGYTANELAPHGVLDEGIEFLQKPFTPIMLARKVHGVLSQG